MPDQLNRLHAFVIDDVEVMRLLVRRILSDIGLVNLHLFDSATEALARMDHRCPNIVITDLRMEGMDGAALLKAVREHKDEAVRRVPVVVLTGHSDQETIQKMMDLGITDFITKPIAPTVLEERIRAIRGLA